MTVGLQSYPAYRDSGQPWVDRVPEHWSMERAKWLFGKMDRPVEERDEVVTCFRDGEVTLRRKRRVSGFTESLQEIGYQGIRCGDLVIHAMDAFAGAIGVSDSDGKGTPVYSVCEPRPGVNAHYCAYLVREMARSQWILALAKGIRERSTDFRFEAFAAQRLPVPPLPEQDAVVRYLTHVDRRVRRFIRDKQKLVKLIEEQKQSIVFRAVTRGLDPSVRLKPSGVEWLGKVPEHWDVVLNQRIFKEVSRPHGGQAETQLSLSQRDGLVATSEMQERSLQTSSFENWKVTVPGDLVLNRFKAHLGVFFSSTLRGIVSFHYGVFVPRQPLVTKYFELLYHTNVYRTIYAGRSNGMTVGLQNLSNQNFYGVRSVVPPFEEQAEIASFVEKTTAGLNQAIEGAKREILLLREYHSRLVADVVTGKRDVREAASSLADNGGEPEAVDDEELWVDEDGADGIGDFEAAQAEVEA